MGKKEIISLLIKWLAICFGLFQFYTVGIGQLPSFQQRLVHLSFALCLTFLLYPSKGRLKFIDYFFIIAVLIITVYTYAQFHSLWLRSGDPSTIDVILGTVLIIALIEGTRRILGWLMPSLAVLAIIYALYGRLMPQPFDHGGYLWDRIVNDLFLTTNGIFGIPLGASATVVAIFIVFSSFLRTFGGGTAFITLAHALFGMVRGGPAKVAVVASGLMGTIQGSAIANVAATGTFTIPLMKKEGFSSNFSASVEAVASTGGQLMPPVMGTAAFLMAEILNIPYVNIILAAIIPALLYYANLFLAVDLYAVIFNKKGKKREDLPNVGRVIKENWILFVPIVALIYFLIVIGFSPSRSAFFSILIIPVLSILVEKRIRLSDILKCFEIAGRTMLHVALVCATAGIIMGMLMLTGLGFRLSSVLITLSAGSLEYLLILTALASIVLGMGLPTSACYILLAILVAPALVEMGIPKIPAHMFVFYIGLMANITPPVALASYTAAGIANTNPFKVGLTSVKLGLSGFIIAFYFIYRPEILLGVKSISFFSLTLNLLPILLGLISLTTALSGYLFGRLNIYSRIVLIFGAICLVYPSFIMDVIGYGSIIIGVVFLAIYSLLERKGKKIVTKSEDLEVEKINKRNYSKK